MTEPFDAIRHRLEPTDNQNLDFLKAKQDNKSELSARFNMRINKTISILNNYKQQLTVLQTPKTPNSIKTIIENKKIQINNTIDHSSSMLKHDNTVSKPNLNYHELNQILRVKLKEMHQESLAAMTFSAGDITIYQRHKSSLKKLSDLIVAVNLQLEPLLLKLPALPKVERIFSSFKSAMTQFLDSKKNQLTEKINSSQPPKIAKKTFPQALKNLYDELKKDNTGSLFNVTFKDTLIDYAFASYHETKSLNRQDPNSLLATLRQATDTKPELKDDINHLVDDMGELFNLKSRALKAQASLHKEKNIMGDILDKNILIKTTEIKERLAFISEQLSSKYANKIA